MKAIYSILIIAIIAPLFFFSFSFKQDKHKEVSNLEKHQKLREQYLKLMQYHIQENSMLNTADSTEKELSLIHIELAKEYSKLYLRETGIVTLLEGTK